MGFEADIIGHTKTHGDYFDMTMPSLRRIHHNFGLGSFSFSLSIPPPILLIHTEFTYQRRSVSLEIDKIFLLLSKALAQTRGAAGLSPPPPKPPKPKFKNHRVCRYYDIKSFT
jgi:hypothetical protein